MFSVISFCLSTIMHQLMTINAIYIYCLIPIFCGFSYIYAKKFISKEKIIGRLLIILTLCSTVYYYFNYVQNRTFMDLRDVNLKNSIDGGKINKGLSNIRWITMFYPDNPEKEISNIKIALKSLEDDKKQKNDYYRLSIYFSFFETIRFFSY